MRIFAHLIVLMNTVWLTASALQCQTESSKYWVFLTDKDGVEFDACSYFDEKAIERRKKLGVDLYDSTDFPLNEEYKARVSDLVDEVLSESRWFNALAVKASSEQLPELEALAFVDDIKAFIPESLQLASSTILESDVKLTGFTKKIELIQAQTMRMGRRDFAKNGIDGKNVRIAIFDAGFTDADINGCFKHVFDDNRVIDTYDFIKKEKNVYHGSGHGTAVWSCIAGITSEKDFGTIDTLGLATGAEFLLARTERGLIEVFSEEENWLAALEWADKNGADIINSSLGYGGHRYTYADMDGTATLVSRAGNLAAKKGILVVNSAGNEGTDPWNFIGAPADADSVLAVGGLLPWTGIQTNFSSVGPTFDYRIKPNVTAYGHVMGASKQFMSKTQGTSFSSPLMAGFAACAWQANPGWTNMQLFHELEKGADLYPYFDYAHGYGVPLAENFISRIDRLDSNQTHEVTRAGSVVKIVILEKKDQNSESGLSDIEVLIGQGAECHLDYNNHLFYHFANAEGHLLSYHVVNMKAGKEVFSKYIPEGASIFRSYFEGNVQELKLNE